MRHEAIDSKFSVTNYNNSVVLLYSDTFFNSLIGLKAKESEYILCVKNILKL